MKADLLATGLRPGMLDSPVAKTLEPTTWCRRSTSRSSCKDHGDQAVPGRPQEVRRLHRRARLRRSTPATSPATWPSWACRTRQERRPRKGFIDGLRKLGTYKEAGLACAPVDISLAGISKAPTKGCPYYVTFKDGKFVVMNKGKPIIGKIVGSKEALAANAAGDLNAAATTTTAAPAP